jgi:hypothetical protein
MSSAMTQMARELRRVTGVDPVIEQTSPTTWRLSLRNSRVHLTVDFKASMGKPKWMGSTLTIDGQERPHVDGYAEFGKVWRDPDSHLPRRRRRVGTLAPIPPGDISQAPAIVRQQYDYLQRLLPAPVEAGYADGRWTLGITMSTNTGLRLFFTRCRKGWHPDPAGPIQMIAAGRDRTAEAGGRVEKALAMLTAHQNEPTAGGPPVAASDSSRSIAVEMRKGNVIRL